MVVDGEFEVDVGDFGGRRRSDYCTMDLVQYCGLSVPYIVAAVDQV